MKQNSFVNFLLLLIVCLLLPVSNAKGQLTKFKIRLQEEVYDQDKRDYKIEQTPFLITRNYVNFKKSQQDYQEILKNNTVEYGKIYNSDQRNRYSIEESTGAGEFEFSGVENQGIIIISYEGRPTPYSFLFQLKRNLVRNAPGKVDAMGDDMVYRYSCEKDGDTYVYTITVKSETRQLGQVTKTIQGKHDRTGRTSVALDDLHESWSWVVTIPYNYHEDDSRIIIFPYAVDCETGDTVDYLSPMVYEGENYHNLQDRRKDFDYFHKDPFGGSDIIKTPHERVDTNYHEPVKKLVAKLDKNGKTIPLPDGTYAMEEKVVQTYDLLKVNWSTSDTIRIFKGFISDIEHDSVNKCMVLKESVVWTKRDKNRSYRGELKVVMEDFHRVYFQKHDPGTCLKRKPYKFLSMTTSMEPLPLNRSFYEPPKIDTREGARDDVGMQFVINTANLIEDSVYILTLEEISRDLDDIRANDGKITGVKIVAYASPDGRIDRNRTLTEQRAQTATRVIREYVHDVTDWHTDYQIDSWEHTADLLTQQGHPEEALQVREIAASHPSTEEAWRYIRAIPTCEDIIKPVLRQQCRVSFSYNFVTTRALSAEEALERYYHNKRGASFSNGDYYNLFRKIQDEKELDTLTVIAYERIIKTNRDYNKAIAPYVINRMALLNEKRNTPDSTTLAPMISDSLLAEFHPKFSVQAATPYTHNRSKYELNRPELVLNQAVMFYKLDKMERALDYLDYLKKGGKSSEKSERLRAYIRFRILYNRLMANQLTESEMEEIDNIRRIISATNRDNQAVLYTEFIELFPNEAERDSLAWKYVHLMDDNNPRKWYLMGILWSKRDGKESVWPLNATAAIRTDNETRLLTQAEQYDLQADNPLAYQKYKLWEADTLAKNPDAKPQPLVKVVEDDANVKTDSIPYYMAYFYHSFELEEQIKKEMKSATKTTRGGNEMMRYYFSEGFIDEKTRGKKYHAFKNDRIKAYQKIFRLRKRADDADRARYLKEEENKKQRANVQ